MNTLIAARYRRADERHQVSNKLTVSEWAQLRERETIIKDGEKTFIRVGTALAEIRDLRLYREKYVTFQEYVEKRLGWTKQRAYQVMEAAKVVKELPPESQACLTSARAAEEVARVPQEHRAEVVEAAAEAGPVTAASVKEAAAAVVEVEAAPVVMDCAEGDCQREVPALILDNWQRATAISKDLLVSLRDVQATMRHGAEHRDKDTIWADTTNTDFAGLSEVIGHLNLHVKPHAVCPQCHGLKASIKGFKLCKGRGYIGRHLWQTCVPAELKDVLAKGNRKKGQ